jgi:UDP:flavonoid glycosyltransferase YjiC (YdhE family)
VLPPPPDLPDPNELPWVLITLGTSFDDDPVFFTAAADAVHQLGCLPLMIGQRIARQVAQLGLPPTAVARPHVDFRQVLPNCVAAIHHGGAGTTHALALHGVPQIVSPHAADQIHQARGVERSGVGLHLPPRSVTPERLAAALATLLPDRSEQRHNAQQLQSEMAGLGGAAQAAVWLRDGCECD